MKYTIILFSLIFWNSIFAQNYTCELQTIKQKHGPINSVALLGDTLITGHDELIVWWDLDEEEEIFSYSAHNDIIRTIAVHPSKKFYATGGDKNLLIWDAGGNRVHSLTGQTTSLWHIEYGADGEHMVSSSFNKSFNLRNGENGEIIKTLEGHKKSVLATALSPNGKWIASGSLDKMIYLWGMGTKETHFTLEGHSKNIYTLNFSDDSKLLASGSLDNNIKIWNAETGAYITTMSGHENGVMKVEFFKNPQFLLSCSYDNTLKMWDTEKGDVMFTFEGHEKPVVDFQIYDNDSKIVSVSLDGTIRTWEVSPKIFVDYFYGPQIDEEINNSSLYKPKRKNESRSDYKARKERAVRFEEKLYKKYFEKFQVEVLGLKEE